MDVRSYTKDLLKELGDKGYSIIPCKPEEQEDIFYSLRSQGKCARAGYIYNQDHIKIYFVLTKSRGKVGVN